MLWNEILRYETVSWKVDVKKKEKIISLSNEIIASQVDYLPYYYVDIWQDARIEIRVMLCRGAASSVVSKRSLDHLYL